VFLVVAGKVVEVQRLDVLAIPAVDAALIELGGLDIGEQLALPLRPALPVAVRSAGTAPVQVAVLDVRIRVELGVGLGLIASATCLHAAHNPRT
jgi:hypothetical protein